MRPTLDEMYLGWLPKAAARTTCAKGGTAALLVDAYGRLVAAGYNGVPTGSPHCEPDGSTVGEGMACRGACDPSRDLSRCLAVHAEVNAVLNARGDAREAVVLYCSRVPCWDCAKMLLNLGVQRVVVGAAGPRDVEPGMDLLVSRGVGVEFKG